MFPPPPPPSAALGTPRRRSFAAAAGWVAPAAPYLARDRQTDPFCFSLSARFHKHASRETTEPAGAETIPACPVELRASVLAAFDVLEGCALRVWAALAEAFDAPTLGELGARVGGDDDLARLRLRSGGGASSEVVSSSPFDLMFYPNAPEWSEVANSTAHVDSPGLVTVVPCALTPGLAILDQRDGRWIEVETLLEPCRDVLVFGASSLQILSKSAFRAATHEVRKHAKPRLSLVYELRPSMRAASDLAKMVYI